MRCVYDGIKNNVTVSIIVPVYNAGAYLPRCIQSICSQTLTEIEVILVDDGSTDSSGKICDEYALKDSRITVIHKKNGGLVSTRQTGLKAASGEYVGFVDSDDWIEPDMYQSLYNTAGHGRADVAAEGILDDFQGECTTVLNSFPVGIYKTPEERENLYKNMLCCKEFFCLGIQPYLCNKIFRRELALRHMLDVPQEIRVGEDAAAVYPMLAMADSIAVSDKAHYHYCHHSTSMMLGNRNEEQEYRNALLVNSFLKKSFMDLGIYSVVEEPLKRYTINNLLVRAYGRFAALAAGSLLFPFPDIWKGDSVIIYGAGALGRAVYQYAVSCGKLRVKAFADQNAPAYRRLGLDVWLPKEITIEKTDRIVVAVFSEPAYQAIRRSLMQKGADMGQIRWIAPYIKEYMQQYM